MTVSQIESLTDKKGRAGNVGDAKYLGFLQRVQKRFLGHTGPFFTTDAELWPVYLEAFPAEARQFHNCHSCRRFIEGFGGLVTIDETGAQTSAIWHLDDDDGDHGDAIAAMLKTIRRAKVTGIFLSSEKAWGHPVTGVWTHLHIVPQRVFSHAIQTAFQASAEKHEDCKNVQRALDEFSSETIAQALTLLKSDALYRSEKVLGPAQWLADLHAAIATHKGRRHNLVWRAVASAPAGFCHPRSSMIGTLLEDIIAGMPFEDVSRRFRDKMHPLQYQRPQAAPSAGNIAQAEKVIAQLNATGSLERRFARVDEIDALWRPKENAPPPAAAGGVFAHLKPKESIPAATMRVPPQVMTWDKFRRTILPGSEKIELLVPSHDNFIAILTAANPEAPPILQWDSPERRNSFSVYVYHGGSTAESWKLVAGQWTTVTAIALLPAFWFGADLERMRHHPHGTIFVLEGAKDFRKSGNAIFPETLKSDFHGIRSTIEAYSRTAIIAEPENASACGIALSQGRNGGRPIHLRVSDGTPSRVEVQLDRWD